MVGYNISKSDSHLPKIIVFSVSKPFKNDEKCFAFYVKRFFRSQDI